MEDKNIKSICCKAEILEFPEYNLKVYSGCRTKVTIHNKKKDNFIIYDK